MGAHGSPVKAPPINPNTGAGKRQNICKVIWRWEKSFTALRFAAIATFLALNQILLREANSIFSLPSFALYEIGNKLGRGQRKGSRGRPDQDVPMQPRADSEVRS